MSTISGQIRSLPTAAQMVTKWNEFETEFWLAYLDSIGYTSYQVDHVLANLQPGLFTQCLSQDKIANQGTAGFPRAVLLSKEIIPRNFAAWMSHFHVGHA